MNNVVKKLMVLISLVFVINTHAMQHENGHQNGHDAKHPGQSDQDVTLPGSTVSPKASSAVTDDKEFERALKEACKEGKVAAKIVAARITELLTKAQNQESDGKKRSIQSVFLSHANSAATIAPFLKHEYSRSLFSEFYNIFIDKITQLTERSMTRTKTSVSIKLLF